ncbi:conserved hypothetical protein [Ricinus communis]|uniref:Uncharacterized protein n=1 Tax=Ricinus communis TaxID=3988 RepID=B9TI62_RICCO|nr:conserved hypothetical protein [Ricinus communis]
MCKRCHGPGWRRAARLAAGRARCRRRCWPACRGPPRRRAGWTGIAGAANARCPYRIARPAPGWTVPAPPRHAGHRAQRPCGAARCRARCQGGPRHAAGPCAHPGAAYEWRRSPCRAPAASALKGRRPPGAGAHRAVACGGDRACGQAAAGRPPAQGGRPPEPGEAPRWRWRSWPRPSTGRRDWNTGARGCRQRWTACPGAAGRPAP